MESLPRNLSAGGDGSSPHPHLLDPSNLQPQTQPETHQQLAVGSLQFHTSHKGKEIVDDQLFEFMQFTLLS
ncbi:hypothetical protein PDE_01666 [Penicillium oxalicum 114-2]|uniref:Uncharacterized protein n=1 Tax=Penicillium oxalicum (strain 114-2 / CGMCC 5302) TaxID=933388 RepID=S8ALI9_PENO1|nr:hypothetical protein PDE_01666 [Penicillium oxalicum 114-2]